MLELTDSGYSRFLCPSPRTGPRLHLWPHPSACRATAGQSGQPLPVMSAPDHFHGSAPITSLSGNVLIRSSITSTNLPSTTLGKLGMRSPAKSSTSIRGTRRMPCPRSRRQRSHRSNALIDEYHCRIVEIVHLQALEFRVNGNASPNKSCSTIFHMCRRGRFRDKGLTVD